MVELYDRRMSIEEQFRDTKGCRFGIKMEWTKFATCEAVNRLFLLASLAMTGWMTAGAMALRADPTMRLASSSKGPRRSIVSIGIEAKSYGMKALRLSWRKILSLWPPVKTRVFDEVKKQPVALTGLNTVLNITQGDACLRPACPGLLTHAPSGLRKK